MIHGPNYPRAFRKNSRWYRSIFWHQPAGWNRRTSHRLGKVVDEVATMLGVVPEILATRKDLPALIRGERAVRPLSGWRKAVIGEPLLAAVNRG
mgnify:CR=1 FL=1